MITKTGLGHHLEPGSPSPAPVLPRHAETARARAEPGLCHPGGAHLTLPAGIGFPRFGRWPTLGLRAALRNVTRATLCTWRGYARPPAAAARDLCPLDAEPVFVQQDDEVRLLERDVGEPPVRPLDDGHIVIKQHWHARHRHSVSHGGISKYRFGSIRSARSPPDAGFFRRSATRGALS
jgi:hypothetical protein